MHAAEGRRGCRVKGRMRNKKVKSFSVQTRHASQWYKQLIIVLQHNAFSRPFITTQTRIRYCIYLYSLATAFPLNAASLVLFDILQKKSEIHRCYHDHHKDLVPAWSSDSPWVHNGRWCFTAALHPNSLVNGHVVALACAHKNLSCHQYSNHNQDARLCTWRGRHILTPPSCSIIYQSTVRDVLDFIYLDFVYLAPVGQPSDNTGNSKQHREEIEWETWYRDEDSIRPRDNDAHPLHDKLVHWKQLLVHNELYWETLPPVELSQKNSILHNTDCAPEVNIGCQFPLNKILILHCCFVKCHCRLQEFIFAGAFWKIRSMFVFIVINISYILNTSSAVFRTINERGSDWWIYN